MTAPFKGFWTEFTVVERWYNVLPQYAHWARTPEVQCYFSKFVEGFERLVISFSSDCDEGKHRGGQDARRHNR